jgi:hypothetical protein
MLGRNIVVTNLAAVAAARASRPAVMRPEKVNGKWRMPRWGALAIARARREAVLRGHDWKWDIPKKDVTKKVPFKGHLRHAQQAERAEEVKRCMARMPSIIEEYRKNKPKRTRLTGLALLMAEPRTREATTVGIKSGKKGNKAKA